MLHKLSIKNYAIIQQLDIEFDGRMNIITGETGAGKSILLGALGLILGERADTKILHNTGEKCIVEADFDISGYNLKNFFAKNELDYETHTLIRREINPNGKSRAFVNDTPVTLDVLKQLGEKLVNLHSQHETLELTKAGFQLSVVDALAKNEKQLTEYREIFFAYKKSFRELEELVEQHRTASAELDYLNFQLTELREAKLEADEQEQLETEQSTLSHVEEIKRALQAAIQLMRDSEVSVLNQLAELQAQLRQVKNLNKDIQTLSERLQSANEELKDIDAEFESLQESILLDPERLEEVNQRLHTIYRLQKKHGVNTIKELLRIQQELEQKVTGVTTGSGKIEKQKVLLEKQLRELLILADALHHSREKVLREFQNNVIVLLTKVGMPNASFKVDIKKLEPHHLNENGLSQITFLFSANKGFAPQEIKEVASGGELSRLMLCIKSLIADAVALPTLIFDEIDAGISGEVALKVGEIMKKLSRQHQLIAITHLPQIARAADVHFYIYKENMNDKTVTRIKQLTTDERIMEIAKMLSGEKLTDAALANAREMMAG